jgi:hypothetical protein
MQVAIVLLQVLLLQQHALRPYDAVVIKHAFLEKKPVTPMWMRLRSFARAAGQLPTIGRQLERRDDPPSART